MNKQITDEQFKEWADFFIGCEVTIGQGPKVWTIATAYTRGAERVVVCRRKTTDKVNNVHVQQTVNFTKVRIA